jgi:hypothetical protein
MMEQENQRLAELLKFLKRIKDPEEHNAALRQALLADRYFLAKFLGYDDAEHPWDAMQIHILRDVVPDLEKLNDYWACFFAPRGTYKTAIEEICIIANILQDSTVTIGLGAWKLDVAERIVKNVKSHLENPLLIALFPDILYPDPANKAPLWSNKAFTVKRPTGIREETLSAFSIESMATSRHFRKIYIDDAVERRNTHTSEAIDKTKEILQDLPSLLINGKGSIEVRGTFWDTEDWHIKTLLPSKEWKCYKVGARVGQGDYNPFDVPVGELVFPNALDERKLTKFRASMSEFHFNTQYLMNPEIVEGSGHLPGKLVYYSPSEYPERVPIRQPILIVCDLGTGTEESPRDGKDPDDTTIGVYTVNGHDANYKLDVIDGVSYVMGYSEAADWLFDFKEKYGGQVLVEEIGQAKAFEDTLFQKRKEWGKILPHGVLNKQVAGGAVKERIKNLEHFFQRGRIRTLDPQAVDVSTKLGRRKREFFLKLEHQKNRWPKVAHDDILDTLEIAARKLYPTAAAVANDNVVDFTRFGGHTFASREVDSRHHGRVR